MSGLGGLMRIFRNSALGLLLAMITGCAQYPLGMTEEEWNSLSPQQQYDARQQQANLDAVALKAKQEERTRQATIKATEDDLRVEQLRSIYENPRFGDIQDCQLYNLLVDYHPGWRQTPTIYFSIARSEDKYVNLRSSDGKRTSKLWLYYREDGSALIACRAKPSRMEYLSSKRCGKYSIGRYGAKHSVNIPDILRGELRCRTFKPDAAGKTVIIIQD